MGIPEGQGVQEFFRANEILLGPVDRFASASFDLTNRQAGHFFQQNAEPPILGYITGKIARSKAISEFVEEIN